MNHIYRLVWNAVRQAWIAVAETAGGHSSQDSAVRRTRRRIRSMGLAGLAASAALPALAQTAFVAPGQQARSYVAPNGVTVVDISSANAAGVSHNLFTQYNVGAKGLVLNNTTSTGALVNASQLAGSVRANAYSSKAARLIVNEVVSANPSTLAGFTEVAGQRADVVVANPYGITCSGCGFINTDRVTLSTGTPRWNSDGSFAGFNVQQGTITINGNGLNASAQQILDLVTRSVAVAGQVNAQDLGIAAGTGPWNYTTRSFGGTGTGTGAVPSYAIDASLLGAMYANQIRLVANEAGVGVRMLGDAAAQIGDVAISAAGKVELQNRISAARGKLNVASADSLSIDPGASLAAAQDISLGGKTISIGSAAQIVSAGTLEAAATDGMVNAGTTQALGTLTVKSQSLDNAGTLLSTAGNTAVDTGTLVNETGATLAAAGNLNINAAASLTNNGLLGATAGVTAQAGGAFVNGSTASIRGISSLSLGAGGAFTNQGSIATNGKATVAAQTDLSLAAGSTLTAGQDLSLAAGTIANAGTTQAQGALTVTGQSLDNAGTLLSMNGNTTVNAASLTNESGANLAANGNLTASAGTLTNDGLLGATGDLVVQASGAMSNGSSGSLQGLHSLNVAAGGVLTNQGSIVTSGSGVVAAPSLTNAAGAELRAATGLNITLGAGGLRNSGAIQAGTGQATEPTLLALTSSGSVTNSAGGDIEGGGIQMQAASVLNQGTVTAGAGGSAITATAGLTNAAGATLTLGNVNSGTSQVNAGHASNEGTMQTQGSLALAVGSGFMNGAALGTQAKLLTGRDLTVQGSVVNAGVIDTGGAFAMTAPNATLALNGSGSLQAATVTLGDAPNGNPLSALIMDAGTQLVSQGDLSIFTSTLLTHEITTTSSTGVTTVATSSIMGAMGGSGQSTVTVLGNLDNHGLIYSKTDLSVAAPNITVEANGALAALHDLNIAANAGQLDFTAAPDALAAYQLASTTPHPGDLLNRGLLYAGNDLSARVNGTLLNAQTITTDSLGNRQLASRGTINGAHSVNVVANTIVNNADITSLGATASGAVTGGDVQLTAATLRNEVPGGDTRVFNTYLSWNSTDMTQACAGSGTPNSLSCYNNLPINAGTGMAASPWLPAGSRWDDGGAGGNLDLAQNFVIPYRVVLAFPNGQQPLYYPTVTAANNVSLYFNKGSNLAGLVQGANSVLLQGFVARSPASTTDVSLANDTRGNAITDDRGNIVGLPSSTDIAPTFTNDSLSQVTEYDYYRQTATQKQLGLAGGIVAVDWSWCNSSSDPVCTQSNLGSFAPIVITDHNATMLPAGYTGARIYTNQLTGNNFTFYNEGTNTPAPSNSASFGPATLVSILGQYYRSSDLTANGCASGTSPRGGTFWFCSSGFPAPVSVTAAPLTTSAGPQPGQPATNPAIQPGTGTQTGWTPVSGGVSQGSGGLSFGGITVSLPTSANGLYVLAKNPTAGYLIESNPLYGVNSSVGSDYLFNLLGFSTDGTIRRLGDDSYEAWLVQQQLISQTGSMLLTGYNDLSGEMRGLFDDASKQAMRLGLVMGQALTPGQIAGLTSDIVWMVRSTVNGQDVLVPVVYLCQATKDGIQKGAIISARSGTMNVNGGGSTGTIQGVNVVDKGGAAPQPALPGISSDVSFGIVRNYLLSTGGGSVGIADVNSWLAQNRNNQTAIAQVVPYAFQNLMGMIQGGATLTSDQQAFVQAVASYARQQRLAAVDKALADYQQWKKNPPCEVNCGKHALLTSLFDLGPTPPDWIMNEARSGLSLSSDQQQKLGVSLGIMAGAGGVGGAIGTGAVAGGADLVQALFPFIARTAGMVVTESLQAASVATGPAAIVAGALAIAGQAAAKVIQAATFEQNLQDLKNQINNHAATDFQYWLGQPGGQQQLFLSMTAMMTGG